MRPIIFNYFNFPYSSSDTGSHHSFDISSPGTSTARWLNQLSGAAPCQCFTSGGMLTLSGKKEKGKDIFAKYFIESVLQNGFGEAELYILDDMTRKWGEYEFHPKTALYVNTSETLQTVIDEIDQRVQMRYEQFSEGQLDVLEDEPWIVLIIESADAIADISGNKQEIAAIRSWLGKYRTMKIFILMTNVENANIAFNAPELLKVVKDNRRYLIFEDAANIKMCDISISVAKKYAKPNPPFKKKNNVAITDTVVLLVRENEKM